MKEVSAEIVNFIAGHHGSDVRQIQAALGPEGPARSTVQRRLADLIGQGELRREGAGRAAKYFRDSVKAYLDLPSSLREPVGYDSDRLALYRPNEVRLIPEALSAELQAIGAIDTRDP